jgi:hypothetical protein
LANRYSVLLEFLENSNSYSIFEFEGKKKIIAVTYFTLLAFLTIDKTPKLLTDTHNEQTAILLFFMLFHV